MTGTWRSRVGEYPESSLNKFTGGDDEYARRAHHVGALQGMSLAATMP